MTEYSQSWRDDRADELSLLKSKAGIDEVGGGKLVYVARGLGDAFTFDLQSLLTFERSIAKNRSINLPMPIDHSLQPEKERGYGSASALHRSVGRRATNAGPFRPVAR